MWSVTSQQTNDLLVHEQGHYNIVALVMQNLWYDLSSPPGLADAPDWQTAFNTVHTQAQVRTWAQQLIRDAASFITSLETLYDTQTNHSRITAWQARWNQAFFLASPWGGGLRFRLALQRLGIL
jgi:hypothetical protein